MPNATWIAAGEALSAAPPPHPPHVSIPGFVPVLQQKYPWWKVTDRSIRRLIRQGLPAVRVKGIKPTLIPVEEGLAWVEGRLAAGKPAYPLDRTAA